MNNQNMNYLQENTENPNSSFIAGIRAFSNQDLPAIIADLQKASETDFYFAVSSEMANRGINEQGVWIGFPKAANLHEARINTKIYAIELEIVAEEGVQDAVAAHGLQAEPRGDSYYRFTGTKRDIINYLRECYSEESPEEFFGNAVLVSA